MLWLLLACSNPVPDLPPGVLLITVDTWRADHLTAEITPVAWRLTQSGARFTNAFTTIGLTSPAHASLFTGKTPPEHGMRGNNHHGYTLDLTHQTVAEEFQAKGWATAAFVSAYPAGPTGGLDQGFSVFDGPTQGDRATKLTLKMADEWLGKQRDNWFMWVHTYDPHGPYQGSKILGEKRAYAQEVSASDAQIGPLVQRVLAAGGSVVLTSDHGEVLDEESCNWQHERSSSDTVFRIPLVLVGPKVKPGVYGERVGITDLYATLLEMGGLAPSQPVDSHSLLDPQHRELWFAESGLCEPDCSVGCSPSGFLGKDRVALGDAGRLVFRPGRGFVGVHAMKASLADYPAPELPNQMKNKAQGRALGYTD